MHLTLWIKHVILKRLTFLKLFFTVQISGLEKECRDSQRKVFDVERERDDVSLRLRKLENERNELRKRVNEVCHFHSFCVCMCAKPKCFPRNLYA